MSPQKFNPLESPAEKYPLEDFTVHNINWRESARCAEIKGAQVLFLTPSTESKTQRIEREDAAKTICSSCLVSRDCLVEAILNDEYEIRGGLTGAERKAIYPSMVTLADITGPTVERAANKLGIPFVRVSKK